MTEHTCPRHPPGAPACYTRHKCRCDPCKMAGYRERKHVRAGLTGMVPVEAVRAHIGRLTPFWSYDAIGKAANLNPNHVRYIATKARKTRRPVAEAILAVKVPTVGEIDATGTHRRIQALIRCGWTLTQVGERLGVTVSAAWAWANRDVVNASTARKVAALYDELWDKRPSEDTQGQRVAATKSRNRAEANGWPPPAAWDDDTIDDPNAEPDRSPLPTRTTWKADDLAENVEFLHGMGLGVLAIADRLGRGKDAIYTALRRGGYVELAQSLQEREAC